MLHRFRPTKPLSFPEFIALLALLFSAIAFSIDSMLPALPQIATELTPDAVNNAQLVVLSFVLGLGFGTLCAGPISDAYGRKVVISGGIMLYVVGAALAYFAPTLELLLAARVVQGLGAAAPRIVSLAMIRDLYSGRMMAKVMSFVMMLFILMPAVAPSIGALIINQFGWRAVFIAFGVLGLVSFTWMNARQPETLAVEDRRPVERHKLWAAAREVLSNRTVLTYTAILTLGSGQMFAFISSAQQLFDLYGHGENFPRWFALMALLSGTSTILNIKLVMRLGMRRLAGSAYAVQTCISTVMLVLHLTGALPQALAFPAFFFWAVSVFFMAGLTFGNLNALTMESMGHIAGMTASLVGGISLVCSILIAIPIGLAFDGSPRALMVGVLACSSIAWVLMARSAPDAAPESSVGAA